MSENGKAVLVYTTVPDLELAERIAGELVTAGLAACVNILPGMVSLYRWQGKLARDQEVVVIVKTADRQYPAVLDAIRARHPYETPALMVLAVVAGDPKYLDWIVTESSGQKLRGQ